MSKGFGSLPQAMLSKGFDIAKTSARRFQRQVDKQLQNVKRLSGGNCYKFTCTFCKIMGAWSRLQTSLKTRVSFCLDEIEELVILFYYKQAKCRPDQGWQTCVSIPRANTLSTKHQRKESYSRTMYKLFPPLFSC